jgi:hypothetical protein
VFCVCAEVLGWPLAAFVEGVGRGEEGGFGQYCCSGKGLLASVHTRRWRDRGSLGDYRLVMYWCRLLVFACWCAAAVAAAQSADATVMVMGIDGVRGVRWSAQRRLFVLHVC